MKGFGLQMANTINRILLQLRHLINSPALHKGNSENTRLCYTCSCSVYTTSLDKEQFVHGCTQCTV